MQKKEHYVRDEEVWRLIEATARVRHEQEGRWPEVCKTIVQPMEEEDTRWYERHRSAVRTRRLCVPLTAVMLLATWATYLLTPVLDHRMPAGMDYELTKKEIVQMLAS